MAAQGQAKQVAEIFRPAHLAYRAILSGTIMWLLSDVPVDTDDIDKFRSILGADGAVKHAQMLRITYISA
jgi:hypothetical protein